MSVMAQLQLACVKADHFLVRILAELLKRQLARGRGEHIAGDSAVRDRANFALALNGATRYGTLERVELPPDLVQFVGKLKRKVN